MITRPDAPTYLKLLSSPDGGSPNKEYKAHKSLGKGITIYILDSGFDLSPVSSLSDEKNISSS